MIKTSAAVSNMDTTLGGQLDSRNNSIGFLRVALAVTVIVHHSFTLRLGWEFEPLWRFTHQLDLGSLAVQSFLVLSGFLIPASFEKTGSLPRYLWHRVLRLYPGYWMCLLISVLFLAPLAWTVEKGTMAGYLTSAPDGPVTYFLSNLSLWIRQTNISNIFSSHHTTYFNGSLWTLSIEAICYLLVPVIAYMGWLRKRRWLILAAWVILFAWYINDVSGIRFMHFRMFSSIKVAIYFATGALLYAFRDKIRINGVLALTVLVLTIAGVALGIGTIVCVVSLPYLVMWCAFRLPFSNWERRADPSYGIYVYAYPIQQLIISALPGSGVAVVIFLSLAVVTPTALLSWRFIEKPALRLKKMHIPLRRNNRDDAIQNFEPAADPLPLSVASRSSQNA